MQGGRKGQMWGNVLVSMDTEMLLSFTPSVPDQKKTSQLVAFASLTYLFKRLQLPAKFKCCPKIRTYKVSLPDLQDFRMGRQQE